MMRASCVVVARPPSLHRYSGAISPSMVRMAKFFFAFMLMLHFFACSYWGIVWTCVVVVVVVVVVVAKRCSLTARPVSL